MSSPPTLVGQSAYNGNLTNLITTNYNWAGGKLIVMCWSAGPAGTTSVVCDPGGVDVPFTLIDTIQCSEGEWASMWYCDPDTLTSGGVVPGVQTFGGESSGLSVAQTIIVFEWADMPDGAPSIVSSVDVALGLSISDTINMPANSVVLQNTFCGRAQAVVLDDGQTQMLQQTGGGNAQVNCYKPYVAAAAAQSLGYSAAISDSWAMVSAVYANPTPGGLELGFVF